MVPAIRHGSTGPNNEEIGSSALHHPRMGLNRLSGSTRRPDHSARHIRPKQCPKPASCCRVAFEATVTYYRWYDRLLLWQDAGVAISVVPPSLEAKLAPGDRVMVAGKNP